MATKGKGKPDRFIKKFKTGAPAVFTPVSKHYLTCETSTESTNRPRQIANKKNCSSPEMTWVLSLFCWFETHDYNYSISTSPDSPKAKRVHRLLIFLLFSFYRRITVMNTGTAHRSCQTMFTLMRYSMTSRLCTQPVNTMGNTAPHMYKTLRWSRIKQKRGQYARRKNSSMEHVG